MKNLTVKIICLMMALPLIVIFATTTVINGASVLVDIPVSDIEIVAENASPEVNESIKITVTVMPINAKHKEVNFSFKDEEGNEVDEKDYEFTSATSESDENVTEGELTGKKKMTLYVTATAKVGGKKKSVKVSFNEVSVVEIPPESIEVLQEEIVIKKGDVEFIEQYIHYDIMPSNATEYTETWTSSDPSVAIVSKEGRVDAKAVGECEITLTLDKGRSNEISVVFRIKVE